MKINRALIVLLTALVLIMGCSKLTPENYGKLAIGMDYGEVISLIGEADGCEMVVGMKSCTWGDEKKHIKIQFVADKVVFFTGKGL